jgi:hypothetical protein
MKSFEYKVVPAPKKGEKSNGAKTPADRFAVALTTLMNKMGALGWEYIRADTLPCEERVGLTGTKSVYQHMLVFRREFHAEAVEMLEPIGLKNTAIDDASAARPEPKISAIPAELFADSEPDEPEDVEVEPKSARAPAV